MSLWKTWDRLIQMDYFYTIYKFFEESNFDRMDFKWRDMT